uniref:Xylanolytic transcriptional activator regulatory domain-containing protein n=2 Tax=Kwoniella bestiolae CBS 10118 TaxID=1296100 RepID=A0A1B9G1E8_9TREE|nr:hypothetical protein I302_06315 [Kwoniella bestiolae CBS 10118]OCF24854.1 hypothetical protein I302_06315 [Kwoniella bestiolae CBS 10118]
MSPESPDPLPTGYTRYLPSDVYLTEEQHDQAVDRFFRFYGCWGQRTNPILFRQDLLTALYVDSHVQHVKTPHYSPMLHNAILAIGLGMSDDPYLRASETRKSFAKKAKDYIDYEGMNPTVATVQAFAHLASYHSLAAEHNLGWLYIGQALRTGVALGLNMDDTRLLRKGNVTSVQARERNVTFWTTFIQEGLWAPYIGRPLSLPDFTAQPPTVDEELDQLVWQPEDPPTGIDCTLKAQPGMLSTTFCHTVKLMKIGERIMNTLYGIKADMSTLIRTGVISEISLSLSTWLESLPPTLTFHNHVPKNGLPHILMLHLSHAWLVILLHRPFYRPLAPLPNGSNSDNATPPGTSTAAWAVKQCDRAALHVITLLTTWHRFHNLRFCPPTAIQCCFIAGTTHLLSLASAQSPKKQIESLNRAQECIKLMKLMAVSWPAAQHQQVLLENLLSEYGISLGSQRLTQQIDQMNLAKVEPDPPPMSNAIDRTAHKSSQHMPAVQSGTSDQAYLSSSQNVNSMTVPDLSAFPTIPVTPLNPPMVPTSNVIDELNAWMGITTNGMNHGSTSYPTNTFNPIASSFDASALPSIINTLMPNYNYSRPHGQDQAQGSSHNQQADNQYTAWDPNGSGLDADTQALLDNILRPHLDFGEDKVLSYIEAGRSEGARVVTGGQKYSASGFDDGLWVEPTFLADTKVNMMVVQEEIFGPVIVVSNFKDEKEVVELANSTIYSLAAAVFTNDANQQTRLAQQIDAGTIWLNQYGILYPNVPFGGFKHSRIGRDSGTYGLEAYQQVKAVHQNLTQTM